MQGEILIAGGGIGGLVTALSLHQAGFSVRIYEAVPSIEPLGVGINLLPHAVRELDELGLREALEAEGVLCRELAYCTKRGQRIWAEPRGLRAGYLWPQISIHRGALQMVLLQAARERIGDERIHLGHRVGHVESDGRGVHVALSDRHGASHDRAEGALLVAADGIHSAVRKQFYPDEGPPRWNGAIMWRGVAEAPPYLDGHTMIMAGHPQLKFVSYPISHRAEKPGHQQINYIAEKRLPVAEEATPEEREDWTRRAQLEDFAPLFEQWRFEWLDVPALIAATDDVWIYPMVDRDPLPRWTHGRATLLGDAAHPMYPIGSNGASQAIVDARVLTGCLLAYPGDPESALARYEDERRPATAKIVTANRGMGPELPMQLVEERAPHGFAHLHDVISHDELNTIAEQYKRLTGFAIEPLNSRPSLADPEHWSRP
ncbi:MAG: flavin-dependent oxidoreductase [Myxococcales bacterium]|nr:flavin-dependent oxidoreductase [Myxococcales bacterium]